MVSFMITLLCVCIFLHSCFPHSHSWCLFCFWAFPLLPQLQLLSLFTFSQGLPLFLSVAFSASLTFISTSLWLASSHLHHFYFPTCTPRNLSTFKDLEFPLQFLFCKLQPSLPLSYSSSLHHVLSSLAWPLQWAIVMELSWESLESSFFFAFASLNIKINKDRLLLPALSTSVFRLLSFAWELWNQDDGVILNFELYNLSWMASAPLSSHVFLVVPNPMCIFLVS